MLRPFSTTSENGRNGNKAPRASRQEASLSTIAVDMRIDGQISTAGTVKIEGTIEGDVRSETQVLVSKGGKVAGNVHAPEVIVAGEVNGTIRATARTELHATAQIDGDIITKHLVVHEGGQVNGHLQTGDPTASAPQTEDPALEHILRMPGIGVAAAL